MLHLMALKEVNAKELPEMTKEEVMGLQDLDDAFVFPQAEKMLQISLKRVDTFQGPTPVPEIIPWCIRSYFKGIFFVLQGNKKRDLK